MITQNKKIAWKLTMKNEGALYVTPSLHSSRIKARAELLRLMKTYNLGPNSVFLSHSSHRVEIYVCDVIVFTISRTN